jgi:hypothetical protein
MQYADYYLEIYPNVVKNNKLREVCLIGGFFQLDKSRHWKVNKNVFKHSEIGISIDSILDHKGLWHEISKIQSFYGDYDEYDKEDANRIISLKNKLEKIQIEWTKKANILLAWKRRKQAIMAFTPRLI